MSTQNTQISTICIPRSLKLIGIIGGIWSLLTIAGATLAYLPGHPGFSIFGQTAPVIWKWLSILSCIVWMLVQSILIGKTDRGQTLSKDKDE